MSRWILVSDSNRAVKYAVQQERERIIKLLEELSKSTFPGDVWHVNPFEYAIALIKGETNE